MQLSSHLAAAGAGIAGNLIGPLTKLRESAQEGDEDAERAYQEAIAMLRSSGSSTAETMLRDLGEELEDWDESEGALQESAGPGANEANQELAQPFSEEIQEATAGGKSGLASEDYTRNGKIICLECGAEFKQLTSTHLAKHGMSPREYKKKYGIELTTPLSGKTAAREEALKKMTI